MFVRNDLFLHSTDGWRSGNTFALTQWKYAVTRVPLDCVAVFRQVPQNMGSTLSCSSCLAALWFGRVHLPPLTAAHFGQ